MDSLAYPIIAVDGTAASGKSTFSRALAARLGYAYVNTGSMYRGVTWYLVNQGVTPSAQAEIARVFSSLTLETGLDQGELRFRIAGLDPLPHVREAQVVAQVSLVAQVPAVRARLVAEQQSLGRLRPLVMEGRDIGTGVFPQTPYKFYLDADADVRNQRRAAQGEVDVIHQRDQIDSTRKVAPLTCAPDALRLDSGRASVPELVAMALAHVQKLGLQVPAA